MLWNLVEGRYGRLLGPAGATCRDRAGGTRAVCRCHVFERREQVLVPQARLMLGSRGTLLVFALIEQLHQIVTLLLLLLLVDARLCVLAGR